MSSIYKAGLLPPALMSISDGSKIMIGSTV